MCIRDSAGIEKDAVIIGVHDRAEIWSAEAWNAQEEEEMTPEKIDVYKRQAKSLLGVLSLGIVKGTSINLIADGPDEKEAVEAWTEGLDIPASFEVFPHRPAHLKRSRYVKSVRPDVYKRQDQRRRADDRLKGLALFFGGKAGVGVSPAI